jgi:hypothetical protein
VNLRITLHSIPYCFSLLLSWTCYISFNYVTQATDTVSQSNWINKQWISGHKGLVHVW